MSLIETEERVEDQLRKFGYWEQLKQHLFTGHKEVYDPLDNVIKSPKTAGQLKTEQDSSYNELWTKYMELIHGIRMQTRILGGACEECLKLHDNKSSKKFKKILDDIPK